MKNNTKAKQSPAKPVKKVPAKKCRAAEIGHRSCNCGGPYCGQNIHDK